MTCRAEQPARRRRVVEVGPLVAAHGEVDGGDYYDYTGSMPPSAAPCRTPCVGFGTGVKDGTHVCQDTTGMCYAPEPDDAAGNRCYMGEALCDNVHVHTYCFLMRTKSSELRRSTPHWRTTFVLLTLLTTVHWQLWRNNYAVSMWNLP